MIPFEELCAALDRYRGQAPAEEYVLPAQTPTVDLGLAESAAAETTEIGDDVLLGEESI